MKHVSNLEHEHEKSSPLAFSLRGLCVLAVRFPVIWLRLCRGVVFVIFPYCETLPFPPMKLGIINSAFGQAGVDTATGLEHIARIGFDSVDIFIEAMTITAEEKRLVLDTCRKTNLPIISLPVVAVGLIDFNEPVRTFHVERCQAFIDLAAEWGAKNILLVLGEYIWQREVISPAEQWRWAIETCRMLGDYADRKKIDIALELEPFRLSLLNSVGAMVRFVDECNHSRVRANIDVSHLVLADTSPIDLAKLKGNPSSSNIRLTRRTSSNGLRKPTQRLPV
jgi:sugar phosphate isomerase/epimerase